MFKNYFIIALRSILRRPLYSAISIVGLAFGLSCCVLLMSYIRYEFSYDNYFQNADRIYRVTTELTDPGTGEVDEHAGLPFIALPVLRLNFPEIVSATRVTFRHGNLAFKNIRFESGVKLVDPEFFDIFNFRFIHGSAASALNGPDAIVLTESKAKLYFGDRNPVGETMVFKNEHSFKVTAVIEDTPKNTHIYFDVIIPLSNIRRLWETTEEGYIWFSEGWSNLGGTYGYVRLNNQKSAEKIQPQLSKYISQHGDSYSKDFKFKLGLQRIQDIHLYNKLGDPATFQSTNEGNFNNVGSMYIVYALIVVSSLILTTACINFVNLSTATASLRSKEIGIRKLLGANQFHIMLQFLVEAMVITTFAVMLALLIAESLRTGFSSLVYRDLPALEYLDPWTIIVLIVLTLVTTLLAGLYPALVLSKPVPSKLLKGQELARQKSRIRTIMVVIQFTGAFVLIVAATTMSLQSRLSKDIDLGFNKDNIINLLSPDAHFEQYEALKSELLIHPDIVEMTASRGLPGVVGTFDLFYRSSTGHDRTVRLSYFTVDYDYHNFFGIDLRAGRYFSKDFQGDAALWREYDENLDTGSAGAILSESGVRKLGFESNEEAIGRRVLQRGPDKNDVYMEMTIVGVVKDVSLPGLSNSEVHLYYLAPDWLFYSSVKTTGIEPADIVQHINTVWAKFYPNDQIKLVYLDEFYEIFYTMFDKITDILVVFCLFSVGIAYSGLYAMTTIIASSRTKEIGLRKILGASTLEIVKLLVLDFSKPVLLALLFAVPVAIYLVNSVLQYFPEQITQIISLLVVSGVISIIVAWLTVATHTIRVARGKPIHSLRYE